MKTLQDVNREITSLAKEIEDARKANEKRAEQKLQIQIDQLRFFRLYLETNPREESVLKMRDEVQKKISVLESRFSEWITGKSEETNVLKARYNSLMGLSELRHRLKALNYLCE